MSKRIGILTGGGDCPGLNAAIRAVVKHASHSYGYEVVGIKDAFKGLYEGDTMALDLDRVRGLIDRGGTILGSSNRAHPFAYPVVDAEGNTTVQDVSDVCVAQYKKMGLDALVVIGGDGTQGIAKQMLDKGLNIVGIPKTIDNDLEATEFTIGYQTAVNVAVAAMDRLHTTAESHDRIIICEVMGRYAGWIAMNAGISAGVEVILIPEVEYNIEKVMDSFEKRRKRGISFSIVVIAEGAKPEGGGYAVVEAGQKTHEERLGGAGALLEKQIRDRSDFDVRTTVLGHVQRGGVPAAFDRLLASRFGVVAVELIANEKYGRVAAFQSGQVVDVPMQLAVSKQKLVKRDGPLVRTAQSLGIELGF